ncbi:hypothetical protein Hanom_Chr02g00178091 [Helianthus anomalus]
MVMYCMLSVNQCFQLYFKFYLFKNEHVYVKTDHSMHIHMVCTDVGASKLRIIFQVYLFI